MTTAVAPKPASSQRRLNFRRVGSFFGLCSVILITPYVILNYRPGVCLTLPFSNSVVACYEGLAKELWRECGEDVKETARRGAESRAVRRGRTSGALSWGQAPALHFPLPTPSGFQLSLE